MHIQGLVHVLQSLDLDHPRKVPNVLDHDLAHQDTRKLHALGQDRALKARDLGLDLVQQHLDQGLGPVLLSLEAHKNQTHAPYQDHVQGQDPNPHLDPGQDL